MDVADEGEECGGGQQADAGDGEQVFDDRELRPVTRHERHDHEEAK